MATSISRWVLAFPSLTAMLSSTAGCPTADPCHDEPSVELVNADPLSCGPALVTCADATPQVTSPPGVPQDLIDASIEHAQQRLDTFAGQPRRGTAFVGDYWVSRSGTTREAQGEFAELYGEPPTVRLRFSSGFALEFGLAEPGSVTPGLRDFRCPETTPWPRAGEPYVVGPITCEAVDGDSVPVTFSIDARPLVPEELVWDDLVALNEEPYLRGATASNGSLDYEGTSVLGLDSTTFRELGPGASRTFVDYQAIWRLDTEDLESYCVERIDIVNAEICSFPEDLHWHGRYDVSCREIATVDGRPSWAAPF